MKLSFQLKFSIKLNFLIQSIQLSMNRLYFCPLVNKTHDQICPNCIFWILVRIFGEPYSTSKQTRWKNEERVFTNQYFLAERKRKDLEVLFLIDRIEIYRPLRNQTPLRPPLFFFLVPSNDSRHTCSDTGRKVSCLGTSG